MLIKKGQAIVEEVPSPQVEAGQILVKVERSCISIGTEMSGVRNSGVPLWKRALNQPENVKKVLNLVKTQGVAKTTSLVKGKLDSGVPTGYSAAGKVVGIGSGIHDIKIGDRVACAGSQCAFHAEYINVPRNLVVKMPDNVPMEEASTVTLGAIALQGIRRANPTLGETFVVIGNGILGQLTVQMLKANGCRVIVSDLDRQRIKIALKNGASFGIHPEDGLDVEQVARITAGIGADGVIITAATPSDSVVSTAFKMCRRKGRVVLVGDVGLHLNREDFYQKEIDFFISTSYGPGRYDHHYEEEGLDYPAAYVRWTENRNLEEYIRLLSENKIQVRSMIQAVYPVEQATEAYNRLSNGEDKPLMVLLSYLEDENSSPLNKVMISSCASGKDKVRIALAGAGGFAKGMHLPNIKELSNLYHLQAVMSRTGHNAMSTAKQFGASYATTSYNEILEDKDIDAVLIAARHNLHANMVIQALEAGKHVLVEKPLALNERELIHVKAFYEQEKSDNAPVLLTGFNRRHSKYAKAIYDNISKRTNPLMINYRMNAGYIPLDNWVHTEEGGGRNIGEACHIYDLFNFLTNSKVLKVQAQTLMPATGYYSPNDNFVATVSYEDGSVATLTYTALGAKDYPKEHMEIYCDGKVFVVEDYKKLTTYGIKTKEIQTKNSEKGQKEEIEAFAQCILKGGEWPIPLWQQVQAMEIAFEVEKIF
ncbi:bi-domain-containing oxidoreductase [Sporomusa acidovorans]|uniref:bi-domain-containing oxidoreductase n=1 Tax=Sporomusa acidovorans TaxID=112900 RepID=UPI001FE1E008|nr:bi-domain-containing oxidoreductase [Sporomusa acidovorans]